MRAMFIYVVQVQLDNVPFVKNWNRLGNRREIYEEGRIKNVEYGQTKYTCKGPSELNKMKITKQIECADLIKRIVSIVSRVCHSFGVSFRSTY